MQSKELYVFLRALEELHKSKNYEAIGRIIKDGVKEFETKVKKKKTDKKRRKSDING